MTQALRLTIRHEDAVAAIALAGDLDIDAAPALIEAVTAAATQSTTIVLDLHELDFIDSTGIGTLVRLHRRHQETGCAVVITGARGHAAQVFEITGLAGLLDAGKTGEPDLL